LLFILLVGSHLQEHAQIHLFCHARNIIFNYCVRYWHPFLILVSHRHQQPESALLGRQTSTARYIFYAAFTLFQNVFNSNQHNYTSANNIPVHMSTIRTECTDIQIIYSHNYPTKQPPTHQQTKGITIQENNALEYIAYILLMTSSNPS
jgi:hypothetical protein